VAQSKSSLVEILDQARAEIQSAQISLARKRLRELSPASLPRQYLRSFAELCRRSGLIGLGLRSLTPIVRGDRGPSPISRSDEQIEYAALLVQAGLTREGRKWLETMSEPRADLFVAFSHIKDWNYTAAVPALRRYLTEGVLSPYERSIAEVNLFACLVQNLASSKANAADSREVDLLVAHLLEKSDTPKLQRLRRNVMELRAQACFFRDDYAGAKKALAPLRRTDTSVQDLETLFVEKWLAFSEAFDSGDAQHIGKVRSLALHLRHGETLRECDLYEGLLRQNDLLLAKARMGTPFESYRQRVDHLAQRHLSRTIEIPKNLIWRPGPGGGELSLLASQNTRSLDDLAQGLDARSLLPRLFKLLCRDFYVACKPTQVFAELFPEKSFSWSSSPNVVHQAVIRARKQLAQHPQRGISFGDGGYMWSTSASLRLESVAEEPMSRESALLWNFLVSKQLQEFTLSDLIASQGGSERSLQRHLSELLRSGRLRREGAARKTRYCLIGPPSH
jgi:hypothetical protein